MNISCAGIAGDPHPASPSTPTLQIATSSVPAGQSNTSYQATLTATGGTASYTWSSSGVLPSGVSMSAAGAISGTPTQTGQFQFTATVKDSSQPQQSTSKPFTLQVSGSATSPLQITTSGVAAGQSNTSYQTTLTATGGTTPYTWSSSGVLPSGVSMSAAGVISGTPTQTGQFQFTATVKDSCQPQQNTSKSFTLQVSAPAPPPSSSLLDIYGGVLAAPSPNGGTGWFRTEKRGNRWLWVDPLGNYYYPLTIDSVGTDTSTELSEGNNHYAFPADPGGSLKATQVAKYGDSDISAMPAELTRALSWGFNSQGTYGSPWAYPNAKHVKWPGDHYNPVKVPMIGYLQVAYYASYNENNYAAQTNFVTGAAGAVCTSSNSNDCGILDIVSGIAATNSSGYPAMYYRSEELPDVFSPNFELFTAGFLNAQIPSPSSPYAQWFLGYQSDDIGDMWGFGAGRMFPTNPGGHNNDMIGYMVLMTAPTQASNTNCARRGITCTYLDQNNYSKLALASYLQAKYGTIAALDTAWAVNGVPATYTSFGSAGGWGVGTGLLDENGQLGHAWIGKKSTTLADFPATVAADLEGFDELFSAEYFSIFHKYFKAKSPNSLYLGTMTVGSWSAPPNPEILEGMAGNVDAISTQQDPTETSACSFGTYSYTNCVSSVLAMTYNAMGDVPIITSAYLYATADSAAYPCTPAGEDLYATQPLRAAAYANWLSYMWNTDTYPNGSYPFFALDFWQLNDKPNECQNEGLISAPLDNAYDGVQDQVAASTDPICYTNYETTPSTQLCNVQRGGEANNYGDAITVITQANQDIVNSVAGTP